MTAGTAEKVFRLRDKRLKPAAALVLIHLAYRAHYEDGRYAWPSLESIAQACFISRASVVRGIEQLKALGYVRVSPNQRWNEYDAETGEWRRKSYRTTVYDVLTENFRDVASPSEERCADEAVMDMDPVGEVGEGSQFETSHFETPEDARGLNLHGLPSQSATQITKEQQLPPTPTGYPPASGESPEQEDGHNGEDAGVASGVDSAVDAGGDVRRVCAHLAGARRAAGLTCPDAMKRDLVAVDRLLERLRAAGVADPVARVCSVVDWAMGLGGDWWRRRLRSGRRLADGWDELVDDMTLARDPSATSPAGSSCSAGHRADCEHVRAVGEADEFRERYLVFSARHAHDGRLAELADQGLSQAELRMVLRGLLREDAQAQRVQAEQAARDRARVQRELAEARARNGGSMFTAARKGGAA
ncbi:helix-turn-helix domain-containing protein [Bifidobacterium animalis]|uniref:helix-turn-helix domain-containing protein n=1 Tax=Bifidobacterium animalis TaxID=28025 RepID=UPI00080CA1D8|nr:helix-turn-helix domain-containing protein [Bifidobacterium animalis]ANU43222.1 helix-turn-helix domain-containing protein [Bifidobacterium animalis subsp. animalis]PHQ53825.1 helix-turn-helix domain-containing protein [Bifidobacterium animalis subsp. animalis]QQQ90868.1 helix-turn-helix domain-containing protein [Bifidobacterium animalis]UQE62627.1 helix-turn-helix domain-containing protein [Bifidobacterium animalis]